MAVLFLTLIMQIALPIFEFTGDEYVGLSLVNTASEFAEVTVSANGSEGVEAEAGLIALGPGTERALLLREILGLEADPASGWIEIDSNRTGLGVFLATGGDGFLHTAEPADTFVDNLFLPDVRVDTGFRELAAIDTAVAIIVPGELAANVVLELVSLESDVAGEVTIAVPARGSRFLRVSQAFAEFMPDNGVGGRTLEGYIRVTSDVPIAAWQRVDTPLLRTVVRGHSVDELDSSGEVLAPYFVFGGGYRSVFNLINPSDDTITVQLTAEDANGDPIGDPVERTLAPGEAIRSDVQDLFSVVTIQTFPGPIISGYIRVRASAGSDPVPVIGTMNVAALGEQGADGAAMCYVIGGGTATTWTIPLALGGTYYSGIAIANPNQMLAVQTDVVIETFASDGSLVRQSEVSLSPGAQYTAVVGMELTTGWVRVTANLPVSVVAAIGTHDASQLEQVPAAPAP